MCLRKDLLVFILFLDSLFSLNFKKEERKEKKRKFT